MTYTPEDIERIKRNERMRVAERLRQIVLDARSDAQDHAQAFLVVAILWLVEELEQ